MKALLAFTLGVGGVLLGISLQAHHVASADAGPPPRVQIVQDNASALREVLVHYVPSQEDDYRLTYRDFLGTLDSNVRVVTVVQSGQRPDADRFFSAIAPNMNRRTIEVSVPLSIWSKDRALIVADSNAPIVADGHSAASPLTTFLIPPKPKPGESGRPMDWDIVPAVAAAAPAEFQTKEIPIAFDAGDFTIAGKRVLFDANLWERNRARGYPSAAVFKARMSSLVGRDVVMLGANGGDVPRHHMSMYMAALDDRTMLVGDPAWGSKLVGPGFQPGEKNAATGDLFIADESAETQARFDRAAHDLELAGYKVVRIPTIAFDDKTYFAYTNGIYETRDGKKVAWVPAFAEGDDPLVADLDTAARTVYQSLGYEVRPVTVRRLYPSHGTIGCVVNVLSRGNPAKQGA
jgi:hypothetical protein